MIKNFLEQAYRNFTSYNLFAILVVMMVIGHVCYYVEPEALWLRVPDRIMVPVFLLAIGYNASYKISWLMWAGAAIICTTHFLSTEKFYINVLGTYILVRLSLGWFIEKLSSMDKETFWVVNFFLVALSPFINIFLEFGTLAFTLALAGWMIRYREDLKHVVSVKHFLIFTWLGYLYAMELTFGFSIIQFALIAVGSGFVFWLFNDFRTLLMNAVRRRPKDVIEKFVSFLGRKSLEIYILHVVVFDVILYIFV